MRYFQKTIILGLVVTLISFAGGFCMSPMMAEASTPEMGMGIDSSALPSQDCLSLQPDEASHSINVCAVDCITTAPRITTTKKAVVDSVPQISLITPLPLFRGPSSEGTLGSDDTFGISPPSPDILSSVFKRE